MDDSTKLSTPSTLTAIEQMPAPLPLARLTLPPELDGSLGRNRVAPELRTTRANTDVDAMEEFLSLYGDSPRTQRLYRTEIERLLMWCIYQLRMPLSSLYERELMDYRQFLADPQPAEFWCAPRGQNQPRYSPDWRPFGARATRDESGHIRPAPPDSAGRRSSRPTRIKQNFGLEPGSIEKAFGAIGAFLAYLVRIGYLRRNPYGRRRRQSRQIRTHERHALRDPEMQAMLEAVQAMRRDTPTRRFGYERARFLLTLMFNCGPRGSEILSSTMGSFERDYHGGFAWNICGKGNKVRTIPLNESTVVALMRWRTFLGLPPTPGLYEQTPLIPQGKSAGRRGGDWAQPISFRRLNYILQEICVPAAALLADRYPDRPDMADKVRRFSSHWGRHTALTKLAAIGAPASVIMQTAGHSQFRTTMGYIATGSDATRRALEALTFDWGND